MKPPRDNTDPWVSLVTASRQAADPADAQTTNDDAPFGFATRVVAQWRDRRRNEQLAVWQRWSLRAAACSVALLVIAVASGIREQSTETASLLLPIPSLELPHSPTP